MSESAAVYSLTEEELAKYHKDGFVIPNYRLSQATIERLKADHAEVCAH